MAGKPSAQGDLQRDKIMAFLEHFYNRKGYMPTLQEMTDATELPRTTLTWHLAMLRDEGVIDYDDGRMARSLRWPE